MDPRDREPDFEETCRLVAAWLRDSQCAVAFTGAGISTESGIPDFRSPGGIWSQVQPVLFEDFLASEKARQEYWRQRAITHEQFVSSQPNIGHLTLAKWQRMGLLPRLITQNIDELHQRGGSQDVVELHGTALAVKCLDCEAKFEAGVMLEAFQSLGEPPDCPECGGVLKHATISFGQSLVRETLELAASWAAEADLFFAIGSSRVVEPAASLPRLAKHSGARLVIINREPTVQDSSADAVIQAGIGETLATIDRLAQGASLPK